MSDQPQHQNAQEQAPYTPAHPVKRILAWVGIVYMVAIVLLNVYPFFTGGRYLQGVAPLLVCPGAAGMAVIALYQMGKSTSKGVRAALAVLALACLAVFVVGLWDGIPALLNGLGGQA